MSDDESAEPPEEDDEPASSLTPPPPPPPLASPAALPPTPSTSASSSAPPPPPPTLSPAAGEPSESVWVDLSSYSSPRNHARVASALLAGSVVVNAIAVASSIRHVVLWSRLIDDPGAVTVDQIQTTTDRQDAFGIIQLVFLLVVGISMIVWTRRVYRNLEPLGARSLRFGEGWAIGGWFVPFLNLVRPKQIVDDVWRASDPARSEREPQAWRDRQVSPLLHWWWGAWIASNLIGFVAQAQDEATADAARSQAIWLMVSDGAGVVASLLALAVVLRLTDRQIARADRLAAREARVEVDGPAPAFTPELGGTDGSRRAWAVPLVASGVFGALVIPAAYAIFTSVDPEGSSSTLDSSEASEGEARLLEDLERGDCFDLPSEVDPLSEDLQTILSVDVKPCDKPHDLEMVGRQQHPASSGADYPGVEAVAMTGFSLCADPMESYVGAPWLESGLDIYIVQPVSDSWAAGDRTFLCAVQSLALDPLTGTVADSGGVLASDERTPFSLQVGECWDTEPLSLIVGIIDCDRPHDNETYAVIVYEASGAQPFPGEGVLAGFASQGCAAEFDRLVPSSDARDLDFGVMSTPFAVSWDTGHRTIVCALWRRDLAKLVEPVVAAAG